MTSPEQQALPMTVPFARLLLANGDSDRAAMLLHQHLSSLNPDNGPCDQTLLEAASLYSDITGDPQWRRYTARARLLLPPPRPTVLSPRRAEPGHTSRTSGPADEPSGLHQPHRDVSSGPGSPTMLLHEAQTAHWQGRCGQAIHTATRAVDLWHGQHHSGGGTTLRLWLAAMLCACRRDREAEALLLCDGRLLPSVGSPERYEFAVHGIRTFTRVATGHDSVCARRPPLAALAELSAHTAAEAAAQPWPERRSLWWQLLLTLPGSP